MTEEPEIRYERRGAVAFIELNRPKALNALSLAMCHDLNARLAEDAADPAVAAVVIQGAGEKAFCAGGDVRAIWQGARDKTSFPADFFRGEYRLNHRIYHFPKPYIALIDGITMGGGVGVSAHGSHRIATERTLFAMPETGLGLFPDVGASHVLPRLPGRLGLYLSLTGYRMKMADCLYAGVATLGLESAALPALERALEEAEWSGGTADRETVDSILARFPGDRSPAPLAEHREAIDRCFAAESVEGICENLAAEGSVWAEQTLETLERASPTSLKISLEAYRRGAVQDFDETMVMEYRLSQACVAGHDFPEGIRAIIIDKDNAPVWQPASLAEVDAALVESHFASLGEKDLTFD